MLENELGIIPRLRLKYAEEEGISKGFCMIMDGEDKLNNQMGKIIFFKIVLVEEQLFFIFLKCKR